LHGSSTLSFRVIDVIQKAKLIAIFLFFDGHSLFSYFLIENMFFMLPLVFAEVRFLKNAKSSKITLWKVII